MKKYAFHIIILLILIAQPLRAFENALFSLDAPSSLEPGTGLFIIQHNFLGPLNEDPFDTFLGADLGATINLNVRYRIWGGVELKLGHMNTQKEKTIGLAYTMTFSRVQAQAAIDFFSYDKAGFDDRRQNLFYNLGLALNVLPPVTLVANVAYDGYNQKLGMGVGAESLWQLDRGKLQRAGVFAEFFPILDEEAGITGEEATWILGLKLETYGHHFMFTVSNNTSLGTRRAMLGTFGNDPHLGFSINRLLGD